MRCVLSTFPLCTTGIHCLVRKPYQPTHPVDFGRVRPYGKGMEHNLITTRRREVEQEIARLRILIAEAETELADLATAERVLARLSGAKRGPVSEVNKPQQTRLPIEDTSADTLPLTQKIMQVVQEGYRRGLAGMEPREIADAIEAKGWGKVDRGYVRTRTWRMMDEGKLAKIPGTSRYTMPPEGGEKKPADQASEGEQSAGSSDQPARAGEPGREVEHDNIS